MGWLSVALMYSVYSKLGVLSIDFSISVSLHTAIRATGFLTFTLMGLSPVGYSCLTWTYAPLVAARHSPQLIITHKSGREDICIFQHNE
ncbi:MAG: hypothetical protein U9R01_07210 [candidate division WOR-3 bacterium]|nr:hypothetical protein [candidate division WOR-3 bacterium]